MVFAQQVFNPYVFSTFDLDGLVLLIEMFLTEKACDFCMQSICHKSNQEEYLKKICDDVISMLSRNIIQHIIPYPLKYSFWSFTASKYFFSLSKKWSF